MRHPTRRELLIGIAAAPLVQRIPQTPSSDSSLCFMSAVEMTQLIRAKKLSAREVLAAHLKQIDRVNPKVNAIVTLVAEMATEAAAKADEMQARKEKLGPLHGLPVAHKDLFETRGIRTTFGSPLYKDNVPTEDDIVVERMRRAGAILIGKTNTPEFGAGSHTFNKVFGPTRNPYDLAKTWVVPPVERLSRSPADSHLWRAAPMRAVRCEILRHSATSQDSVRRLA